MMLQYPKMGLWFQLWHCYADFEVVYNHFELVTQPSENCT